eukprot:319136-Prymnesium_polylepis.1
MRAQCPPAWPKLCRGCAPSPCQHPWCVERCTWRPGRRSAVEQTAGCPRHAACESEWRAVNAQ